MTKPYKGIPELKQLPATKAGYKGKNGAGGRKAVFSQSKLYRVLKLYSCPIPWDWAPVTRFELEGR